MDQIPHESDTYREQTVADEDIVGEMSLISIYDAIAAVKWLSSTRTPSLRHSAVHRCVGVSHSAAHAFTVELAKKKHRRLNPRNAFAMSLL